jgi:DNA-binding CsgD family transcriptional regulator
MDSREGQKILRSPLLVQCAGSGVPKAVVARDYGISRETVYQYLRHAKLE